MHQKWILSSAMLLVAGIALAEPTVKPGTPAVPQSPKVTPKDATSTPASAILTSRVNELLDSFETIPSESEWKALGIEAAPLIRAVALDTNSLVNRRKRAITALVYFPGDATLSLLKEMVANSAASHRIRGQAALSLALVAGETAIADLTPLLAADKFRLREAAIKAFARINSRTIASPLRARLAVEPKAFLKEEIQKILTGLSEKAIPAAAGAK